MSPTSYQTAPPRSTGREDIGESGKIQGRYGGPSRGHFPRREAAPGGPCESRAGDRRPGRAGPLLLSRPAPVRAASAVLRECAGSQSPPIPQLRVIGPSFTFLLPRDVAQPGSAPEWGSGGRRFESGRPDCARNWAVGNDGSGGTTGAPPRSCFPQPLRGWIHRAVALQGTMTAAPQRCLETRLPPRLHPRDASMAAVTVFSEGVHRRGVDGNRT